MSLEKLNSPYDTSAFAIECPNCWGHQEWNGVICDKQPKRTPEKKDGFILAFVKKYIK